MQSGVVAVAPNSARQLRLLLAEDEVLIRMDIAESLRSDGWVVVEVGTARDALVAVKQCAFDFVLTDVHMPGGLSGMELARIIKQDSPTAIVVVMSGLHVPTIKDSRWFDAFLPKPIGNVARALRAIMDHVSP